MNTQNASGNNKFFGKYRGFVTDNQDPKNLGRLRAKTPAVLGDVETGWAIPCAPYTGDGVGLFAMPPVDAGVWIEFEDGDVSRPLWTGCWWAENQLPEDNKGTAAKPPLKILRTESGLLVSLDDERQVIAISDENGGNMLEIEVQSGVVKVKAQQKVVVEAPNVELASGASHPVPHGDQLLQYLSQVVMAFNTHIHSAPPLVTPPPAIPVAPPMPTLLSTKVKSG